MLLAEDGLPLLLERFTALPRADRARIRGKLTTADRRALDRHLAAHVTATSVPTSDSPFGPAMLARIDAAGAGRPDGVMTEAACAALLRAAVEVIPVSASAASPVSRSLVGALIDRIGWRGGR